MTSRAKPEPTVGIFWVFGGELILESAPVSQVEPWGEARNHPRSHIEHWAVLQRAGYASEDVEYNDPPRGQVVYFPRERKFVVYADRCILTRKNFLRRIMAEMNLPTKGTEISSDDHYRCLYCLRD